MASWGVGGRVVRARGRGVEREARGAGVCVARGAAHVIGPGANFANVMLCGANVGVMRPGLNIFRPFVDFAYFLCGACVYALCYRHTPLAAALRLTLMVSAGVPMLQTAASLGWAAHQADQPTQGVG